MALKDNLSETALRLINSYGSSVELKKLSKTSDYDPSTGKPVFTETIYADKAIFSKAKRVDLEKSGLPDNMWSSVSGIATIRYKAEYLTMDNTWLLNGRKVYRVNKTILQDENIVIQVYF